MLRLPPRSPRWTGQGDLGAALLADLAAHASAPGLAGPAVPVLAGAGRSVWTRSARQLGGEPSVPFLHRLQGCREL